MSAADYTNEAQQRLMRVINALSSHPVTGATPGDVAKEVHCSQSVMTRDLANLEQGGYAERVPETGRWRLAPPIVQISLAHMAALDRAQRRLDETRDRFSRTGS
jgi:DNA-binding IclR family transcriptional regulator